MKDLSEKIVKAPKSKIRELFENDPELYDPRKYCGPGRDAISEAVKEKIEMLGSKNKT